MGIFQSKPPPQDTLQLSYFSLRVIQQKISRVKKFIDIVNFDRKFHGGTEIKITGTSLFDKCFESVYCQGNFDIKRDYNSDNFWNGRPRLELSHSKSFTGKTNNSLNMYYNIYIRKQFNEIYIAIHPVIVKKIQEDIRKEIHSESKNFFSEPRTEVQTAETSSFDCFDSKAVEKAILKLALDVMSKDNNLPSYDDIVDKVETVEKK